MPATEHRPYQLLDDEGRATFLSHFLGAHRAFRRDAGRFPVALRRSAAPPSPEDAPSSAASSPAWVIWTVPSNSSALRSLVQSRFVCVPTAWTSMRLPRTFAVRTFTGPVQ